MMLRNCFQSVFSSLREILKEPLFDGTPPRSVVGLDGYVDNLYTVIREIREDGTHVPYATSDELIHRMMQAQGQSMEREIVCKSCQPGGNAPLMAMGLASLGIPTHCIGFFGGEYQSTEFDILRERCEVTDLGPPAKCIALEFSDCKFMFSENKPFDELNADELFRRCGEDHLHHLFSQSQLISFLNWAGIRHMTQILDAIKHRILDRMDLTGKIMFFDFSDISSRSSREFNAYTHLISSLACLCTVVVSLNVNEARQAAVNLGVSVLDEEYLLPSLRQALCVHELVIHGMGFSMVGTDLGYWHMNTPLLEHPMVTTGGGDHFNSGYCAAKLADLSPLHTMALANATALYYVSSGTQGTLSEIACFLQPYCTSD